MRNNVLPAWGFRPGHFYYTILPLFVNKRTARRTTAEIAFAGADITKAIQPYLLSLTFTDNEEDEADDLRIKLQGREQLWLEKWAEPMFRHKGRGGLQGDPGHRPAYPQCTRCGGGFSPCLPADWVQRLRCLRRALEG